MEKAQQEERKRGRGEVRGERLVEAERGAKRGEKGGMR